jgi:Chaperone of endosialidase
MAFSDTTITATNELSVTDGAGGPVFADVIPSGNKAYILGKLGVGTLNPANALDVEGAAAVGVDYSGSATAPGNGLIIQGAVGVGTTSPAAKFDVVGTLRATQDASLAVTSGNVGIGTALPLAKLQVAGGAIMPSVGNSTSAGLLFPQNPGGGAGDAAWMRYYVRHGESTTLEIGIANDTDDHIALMPSGNVGIATTTPVNRLDVNGDVALSGKHAFRSSDSWLRLNQDGAFTSGTHTPGVFAPGALNVGGVGNWGNPGVGNAWIAGTLAIGTTTPRRAIHVHSDGEPSAEIHSSGATAGFSFTDREPGRQFDDGVPGQRWVLYSLGQTARLWTPDNDDVLTVSPNGDFWALGSYVVADGAHSERAYIGNGGEFREVQVGSMVADVSNITVWNTASGTYMDAFARSHITASDARLKTDVQSLSGALDKVLRLRGVTFAWSSGYGEPRQTEAEGHASESRKSRRGTLRETSGRTIGVLAQEILGVVPEVVTRDSRGMYGVAYGSLVSLLIEAIKELQARLETRLERLERQVLESGGGGRTWSALHRQPPRRPQSLWREGLWNRGSLHFLSEADDCLRGKCLGKKASRRRRRTGCNQTGDHRWHSATPPSRRPTSCRSPTGPAARSSPTSFPPATKPTSSASWASARSIRPTPSTWPAGSA